MGGEKDECGEKNDEVSAPILEESEKEAEDEEDGDGREENAGYEEDVVVPFLCAVGLCVGKIVSDVFG